MMGCSHASVQEKPRVFVLTDTENETHDAILLVRFLVYANNYDIEGLAASTSIHRRNGVAYHPGFNRPRLPLAYPLPVRH